MGIERCFPPLCYVCSGLAVNNPAVVVTKGASSGGSRHACTPGYVRIMWLTFGIEAACFQAWGKIISSNAKPTKTSNMI